MPVQLGDVGIKSWSYEIVVVSDGTNSHEECEDCLIKAGYDPSKAEDKGLSFHPIFADTEMDRNPSCDNCHYTSFIFSPTAECIEDWVEQLESYLREPRLEDRARRNTDYLDQVAERMSYMHLDPEENKVGELYRELRENEEKLRADGQSVTG